MAHEKFYAVCENKCRVDITDKVVKAKISKTIETLGGGQVKTISIPLTEYGITNNENVVAVISVTSNLYTNSGGSVLEWTHYIGSAGTLTIQVRNKSGNTISGITFNVAVI